MEFKIFWALQQNLWVKIYQNSEYLSNRIRKINYFLKMPINKKPTFSYEAPLPFFGNRSLFFAIFSDSDVSALNNDINNTKKISPFPENL